MPAVPCPPPLDHSRPDGHAARWLLATRPAFLSLTLGGVLLGFAGSGGDALGQRWPQAALALLLALLCHAAVNVINDVADHDNGSDAANVARQFPFTGGSRVIQNALLSRRDMARLAQGLFALVIAGGLLLVWLSGPWLLAIGVIGVLLGWGYSAPPLRLNSRGLGELCVLLCFTLLPLGAQVLLSGTPSLSMLAAALPYGLLATALLYINQFPDRDADALAGKRHWVVRLAPPQARYGYLLLVGLALLSLLAAIAAGLLPLRAALLLPLWALPARAAVTLWHNAAQPARLRPALIQTIAAANLYPLALAAILSC